MLVIQKYTITINRMYNIPCSSLVSESLLHLRRCKENRRWEKKGRKRCFKRRQNERKGEKSKTNPKIKE